MISKAAQHTLQHYKQMFKNKCTTHLQLLHRGLQKQHFECFYKVKKCGWI